MERCKSFGSYLEAARKGCQKGPAGPEKGKGRKQEGKEPNILLMTWDFNLAEMIGLRNLRLVVRDRNIHTQKVNPPCI